MATSGVFAGEEEISMLLTDQRNLAAEIEQLVTNINKTSVFARTISARQQKEDQINQLWTRFEEQHAKLVRELPPDHPYVAQNLRVATEAVINKGRGKLATWSATTSPHNPAAIDQPPAAPETAVEPEQPNQAIPGTSTPIGHDGAAAAQTIDWAATSPSTTNQAIPQSYGNRNPLPEGTTPHSTHPQASSWMQYRPVNPAAQNLHSAPWTQPATNQWANTTISMPAAPKLAPITIPPFNGAPRLVDYSTA